MTQVIGLFGPMCSSLNGFNYHKRVTFFDLDRHCFSSTCRSFPEPRPLTKKDLPDLALINPHDLNIWAIWIYVLITKWLSYYKRMTFLFVSANLYIPAKYM